MVPGSFLIERKLPGVRRHEHFVKQNLGAGRIYFCRASEIKRVPKKSKTFWSRRESGVSSVLQGKTLAQAEFTSAEQVKFKREPKKPKTFWVRRQVTRRVTCLKKENEKTTST